MTAPLIKKTELTVRDVYNESILEGISDLEFLKDNLDELSDNFTPAEKDKEKTSGSTTSSSALKKAAEKI